MTINTETDPGPTCERCNKSLKGQESYDLWILVTTYEALGDVAKTGIDVLDGDVKRDYVVIGIECCGHIVEKEWNEMVNKLVPQEESL